MSWPVQNVEKQNYLDLFSWKKYDVSKVTKPAVPEKNEFITSWINSQLDVVNKKFSLNGVDKND